MFIKELKLKKKSPGWLERLARASAPAQRAQRGAAESTAGERLRFPRPRAFLALLLYTCTSIYIYIYMCIFLFFFEGGGRVILIADRAPVSGPERRSAGAAAGIRPLPAVPSEPPPLRRPVRSAGAERPPPPPSRGSRLSPRPPSPLLLRGNRTWLPLERRPPKSLALVISVVVNYPRGAMWLLLQPHRSLLHHTALGAGPGHPLPTRGSFRSPLRDGPGPPAGVTAGADSGGTGRGRKMPSRAKLEPGALSAYGNKRAG